MAKKASEIYVFLSWSGSKSKKVAEALREWLPRVHNYIRPWISTEDIHKGEEWSKSLRKELKKAEVGIICVTPDNLESSWLLFEAGALAQTGVVCTYLFDTKPEDLIKSPLGLFQLTQAKKKDTFRLLLSINKALGKSAIQESILEKNFETLWPELKRHLKKMK